MGAPDMVWKVGNDELCTLEHGNANAGANSNADFVCFRGLRREPLAAVSKSKQEMLAMQREDVDSNARELSGRLHSWRASRCASGFSRSSAEAAERWHIRLWLKAILE